MRTCATGRHDSTRRWIGSCMVLCNLFSLCLRKHVRGAAIGASQCRGVCQDTEYVHRTPQPERRAQTIRALAGICADAGGVYTAALGAARNGRRARRQVNKQSLRACLTETNRHARTHALNQLQSLQPGAACVARAPREGLRCQLRAPVRAGAAGCKGWTRPSCACSSEVPPASTSQLHGGRRSSYHTTVHHSEINLHASDSEAHRRDDLAVCDTPVTHPPVGVSQTGHATS
jgi:hypothetical protein